ncbi:hypothetical protein P8452_19617 [Trifolium repens]|nr:hypothetical protein P8452_19617 [Trifolium repens]
MNLSKGCCKNEIVFIILWFCCHLIPAAAQVINVTDPTEVLALRNIHGSLIDPNGHLSNWNSDGDPCLSNWTGVVCSNETIEENFLHVVELELLRLNLSGKLAPDIGNLAYLKILDFMWNNISGGIPVEIGNIKSLELIFLSGNELTGPVPEELGFLPNLRIMQIDDNKLSGPIPLSFANLNKTKHFHMNNNSLSGQIPAEFSKLPNLIHLLLDNNNLSGILPPELSKMPNLTILQLDNNNFGGNSIPDTYANMTKLVKLSLRNCNLQGPIPDLSQIPHLLYIDLSFNQLNESIPPNKLGENITTIILSNNNLTGTIPSNFSRLPRLQKLSLANNLLSGSVPSTIWQNKISNAAERLQLELQNNQFISISGSTNLPPNVTLLLDGNPLCSDNTLNQFCKVEGARIETKGTSPTNFSDSCPNQRCPPPYEFYVECFCVAPLIIGYRLRSPGFSDFPPYFNAFEQYLTSNLKLQANQISYTFEWQVGPRILMILKIFPEYVDKNSSRKFNSSEIQRIRNMFTGWTIPNRDLFGPYDLMDLPPYNNGINTSSKSDISTGALVGIILGSIACVISLSAVFILLILRIRLRRHDAVSKPRHSSMISIQIDGTRAFTYEELSVATNNFDSNAQIGQGGYGKVYKGILSSGTVVAIKRAQQGSLQGEKEFLTEISILSRLHHRNLVPLVGYCDEEGEQMLVYEFMSNGTLRDHLSVTSEKPLTFAMRLKIALESAKDFGLSRLAPVPDVQGIIPGHVSTVVKGTPGYLDPEYFLTHTLTDKSDVYSLGVVFLELLTGMHPISHGKNIVREVNVAYESGEISSVIDEHMGSYPSDHAEKFLNLALKCSEDEPEPRPKMAVVVRELENICSMISDSDTTRGTSTSTDSRKTVSFLGSTPSSSSVIKISSVSRNV